MSDEQKLNEIHRAIVGEPEYGREGLISKVERHDFWIANAKVRIAAIMGGTFVLCVIFNKAWDFFISK